jgi:hypothetical protein
METKLGQIIWSCLLPGQQWGSAELLGILAERKFATNSRLGLKMIRLAKAQGMPFERRCPRSGRQVSGQSVSLHC